jgi:hypothetical protein
MTKKLIFLSHTHSESEIALLIKNAIFSEFSGFVSVFVSSDGSSIPAGSNFLSTIENALTNCVAAIFLISPTSVKKNWINFELGAVWLKNLGSVSSGESYIPAIPICHSGMNPDSLPLPLSLLNGVEAVDPEKLRYVFKSIQTAVGGEGELRTDFNTLAESIRQIEFRLTAVDTLMEILGHFDEPRKLLKNLKDYTDKYPNHHFFPIDAGVKSNEEIDKLKLLCKNLGNSCNMKTQDFGSYFFDDRAVTGGKVILSFSHDLIRKAFNHISSGI